MPRDDTNRRDKDVKQASQILQVVCVAAIVACVVADGLLRDFDVPNIVYYILGAGVLGIDNVAKLLPGGHK